MKSQLYPPAAPIPFGGKGFLILRPKPYRHPKHRLLQCCPWELSEISAPTTLLLPNLPLGTESLLWPGLGDLLNPVQHLLEGRVQPVCCSFSPSTRRATCHSSNSQCGRCCCKGCPFLRASCMILGPNPGVYTQLCIPSFTLIFAKSCLIADPSVNYCLVI